MINDIWILARQSGGHLLRISFELLARAERLAQSSGGKIHAILPGSALPDSELRKLVEHGADFVYSLESPLLADFLIDYYSEVLCSFIREKKPSLLIAGADTVGRTLMPYIAMKLHTGLTADCTLLEMEPDSGLLLQTRPAIGGNIMATIKCANHRPQMATVRPHSCNPLPADVSRKGRIIRIPVEISRKRSAVSVLEHLPSEDEISIQDAEKLVVVGRGIRNAENLKIVQTFAHEIGAALGASREVIDRGWLPYPHQVGLSGKTVTPKLYIGLGVSGAIQHLAGMQTAETIIAVNRDPEAQIFKVADFGIVGDLFEVLPVLMNDLKKGVLQ